MEKTLARPPSLLKLVAHEVRWNLLRCLAHSDYRVQELVNILKLPQNLISYHLKLLRQGHLVSERHSSADEREVFYRLEVEQLQQLYQQAGHLLHPAITLLPEQASLHEKQKRQQPLRVLFLCTENSARSQMAEALLRHESQGTIEVFSAGSIPAEQIHPQVRACMEKMDIDISQAVPKHLDLFQGEHFDAVITVCDSLHEVCPTFPGDPERIHWSVPDPAKTQGTEEQVCTTFEQTALQLVTRLRFLLPLLQHEKGLVLP